MNICTCVKRNNSYKAVSAYQKQAEIAAINNLVITQGLTVTRVVESPKMIQYRIQLSPLSNPAKLLKMRDNFCIALNDDAVSVFRDKSEIVIEKRGADNIIYMGDMLTNSFMTSSNLTVMLGKDSAGNNTYYNLAKAPHMLIAGATGSGKSVLLNSIISSLLLKDIGDTEIFCIDTKRTELTGYSGIPRVHVITEANEAIKTLERMCEVMDNRYKSLEKYGCRNVDEVRSLGYRTVDIVIVIDEFADLMLLSGKTVEKHVVRLAQKARAAGIHLVIATQRPTRDVITGLIKANIPTRVCLKVTSGLESRIILDRNGGENLTGNGDMLFLANGSFEPVRLQGAFISTEEITNIKQSISNRNKERSMK